MKPEDIKRIAEIIGLEPKCSEDEPFVCLVRNKDGYAVHFQPDTHWYSTGMLLEWLHKRCARIEIQGSIIYYSYSAGECGHMFGKPLISVISSSVETKTLQLAICNAVLSVGEEVE